MNVLSEMLVEECLVLLTVELERELPYFSLSLVL